MLFWAAGGQAITPLRLSNSLFGKFAMRFAILSLTICFCTASSTCAQDSVPSDVRKIMRMTSQHFRQGTQLVSPLIDNASLGQFAAKDGPTSELVSLLSARALLDAAHKKENTAAWDADRKFVRKRVMEEAFDTLTGEVVEGGLKKLGFALPIPPVVKALELALKQAEIEQDVIFFRRSNASQERMAIISELAFAAETYNNLAGQAAEDFLASNKEPWAHSTVRASASTIPVTATARRLPNGKEHVVFLIRNKTSQTIPWAFIRVRLDCSCRPGTSNFAHKRHSRASDQLADVDKSLLCFVENWKPDQEIALAGTGVAEYYDTTKNVSVSIVASGTRVGQRIDMDKHRQFIVDNCWPRHIPVRPPLGF